MPVMFSLYMPGTQPRWIKFNANIKFHSLYIFKVVSSISDFIACCVHYISHFKINLHVLPVINRF